MKSILHILLATSIISSCSSSKKISEEKPVEDIVIHDTMEISKIKEMSTSGTGTKITTTIPVKDMPTIPEKEIDDVEITEVNPQQVVPPNPVKTAPLNIEEDKKNTAKAFNHNTFNTLLQKHVTAEGNVNYEGFRKNSSKLRAYITSLGENLPQETWTQADKLSYWMNAYNAMTIDLILRNMPLKSIKDIKKPWDQRLWKLGDKWYNLEEIEHSILRKMGDARIHFGINCASFSCPPLLNEAFTPAKVDEQLTRVAKKFINDKSRNMISGNSIEVSKIFNWFAKDFKQNGSLIDYLNQYSVIKISESAKVRYMDYNWALNK